MSEEHDSWFKEAFGVDLGQVAQGIKDEASVVVSQVVTTVTQVVQGVEGALGEAAGAVGGAVRKVAGAVSPAGSTGGRSDAGGGSGSFPLSGSVGRGGKNAANDVRAVQAALGIAADGQCGGQTIAAIETFQRNMGQGKPDGRVDAGGATERALSGGSRTAPVAPQGDDLSGLAGEAESPTAGGNDTPNLNAEVGLVDEVLEKAVELSREAVEIAKDLLADLEETGRLVRASAEGCELQAIGCGTGAAGIVVTVTAFIVTGALAPETAGVSLGAWIGLLGGLVVSLTTLVVSYESLIQCQEKRLTDLIKETNQASDDAARDRQIKKLQKDLEDLKRNRNAVQNKMGKLKNVANKVGNLKAK